MNLDKLDAAIAHAEAHPNLHEQAFWFTRKTCGTAACIAGTIVAQDGWTPLWGAEGAGDNEAYRVVKGDFEEDVDTVAYAILGVDFTSRDQTWLLSQMFAATNTLARVKELRNELAEVLANGARTESA